MSYYSGKSTSHGIAIARIIEFSKKENIVRRMHIDEPEKELERFKTAQSIAKSQLNKLYEEALKEIGEENAAIFEVHQMLLEDDDYIESVNNYICQQKVNAEYAVASAADIFSNIFASMEDAYMRERAVDIRDISERLISILLNSNSNQYSFQEPCILVADDLVPSETLQLDKDKVLAFVTRQGSTNSHTAILSRALNIPAVVNVPVPVGVNGEMAIVDGMDGIIIINPDDQIIRVYEEKQKELNLKSQMLLELKGKPTVTKSGKEIKLYANAGSIEDVKNAIYNDAAGIGLFRSEFLYLQQQDYPSEETQFQTYKTTVEMMAGKKVIIRTLDIGADKKIDYFNLDVEENPALGNRAIRICLDRENIFKTQLRALCRAGYYGNLAIMVPMIASIWEVLRVKEILKEVFEELKKEGIPFYEPEFGIMIETPAAALISDTLASEVDFFSIGTNDLTQYTLAVDRQNPKLEKYYDVYHPAILRLMKEIIDNAHKAGIWAGICGELGADLTMTEVFVNMGIDELSISPSKILPIRKQIREIE